MRLFSPRQPGGLLLLFAFVLNLGGVVMYGAGTAYGWVVETSAYHAWERALIMGSYVVAALAAAVLEPALGKTVHAHLRHPGRHSLWDREQAQQPVGVGCPACVSPGRAWFSGFVLSGCRPRYAMPLFLEVSCQLVRAGLPAVRACEAPSVACGR